MKKGYETLSVKSSQTEKIFFVGKLVFNREEKNTYFRDMNGVLHDLLKISFSSNEFNSEDRNLILPKPEIIDGNGAIEESGDALLYSYINGNENDIVIISSIYNIKLSHVDKQLRMGTDDVDAMRKRTTVRNNKARYLVLNDNAKGDLFIYLKGKETGTGNIALKLVGSDGNGNLKLEVNGKVLVKQVDNEGNLISKIFLDNTKDAEKVIVTDKFENEFQMNQKGIIVKGESIDVKGRDTTSALTLKKILTDLVDAIIALTQPTNTGSTIAPPVNLASFQKVKTDAEKLLKENS